jgi:hypothetical protein
MSTIIIVVAVIFILYILPNLTEKEDKRKKSSSKKSVTDYYSESNKKQIVKSTTNYYTENNKKEVDTTERIPTVAALIKAVNSIEDVKQFIKRQNEVDNNLSNYNTDREYDRNVKLCERYQDAFSALDRKILFYQYIPDIDLETDSSELINAYRIYSIQDYKLNKRKLKEGCWNEIYALDLSELDKVEDAGEPKPKYFKSLIEFRKIIESSSSVEEKYKDIFDLVTSDSLFYYEFFRNKSYNLETQCKKWAKGEVV